MKVINKTMNLDDLKTQEAIQIIDELKEIIAKYEENNCKISSWYGECNPSRLSRKLSVMNRGYDYKPILDSELDFKFPNFLLWEIYWVYSNLNLKRGDKVLDIGGSCSLFSFFLASKGIKVIAIDLNPEIVKEANRIAKIMNIDYTAVCSDAEDYLLNTNEKFDFITSICVFEHIEITKRKRIIRNLHNCLKPTGRIAFTFDYKNPSKFVNINTFEDIKEQFLCNENICMDENQEFYDNNINYLVTLFYRKPAIWIWKLRQILHREFSIKEFFKTIDYNDYTFGAIFLKLK